MSSLLHRALPAVLASLAVFTLAPADLAAQVRQKVALMPLSGTNVHPGYLEAGRDILKDHLLGTGKFEVLTAPGQVSNTEMSGADAVTAARGAGAEIAVVAHLSRLSGAGRVRLLAYRAADGQLQHADSIAIAGGPDDLDPALKRLAVGLATGKRVQDTAEIDSVTQRESDPYLRQTANKSFGLRLGSVYAFNRPGDKDAGGVPSLGIFWMYDARNFLGDVFIDLLATEGASVFQVGLGGYYPFLRGNFTPFLGMQAAYSVGNFGGDGGAGIRVSPSFGILFGRLSTVQFRADVGYFFNTYGERPAQETGAPVPIGQTRTISAERKYTHGPQLSLGIGF